jgi:hypothetical protein
MGLFKSIFGSQKKGIDSLLAESHAKIIRIHGVNDPSDAQKIRVAYYLCISVAAVMNDIGKGANIAPIVDKVVDECANICTPLRARVGDLGSSPAQTNAILAGFPKEIGITLQTQVGGSAAFDALYNALSRQMLNKFLNFEGGFGVAGTAAAHFVQDCFGNSNTQFLTVTQELLEVTANIAEASIN